jgi:hypothetical protein
MAVGPAHLRRPRARVRPARLRSSPRRSGGRGGIIFHGPAA